MSGMLGKRCREPEALVDSNDIRESKRFNGEEMDVFYYLPLLEKTLAVEEDGNCASSEDFVIASVMKSLEEEITATSSTFSAPASGDNSLDLDISSGHEGQILVSESDIDLCYLLEASDDELGIPSSPIVDSKDKLCQSSKQTLMAEDLSDNPDLKWQGENWDFENEFENYQQIALFEDAWDARQVQDDMNRDFVSEAMFFDEDFSAEWTLEMTSCM